MYDGLMDDSRDSADEFDPLEALVESSLPLVFATYDAAVRDGVREPVVVLIDCEDAIGREIAESWLGREAVEDAVLAVQAEQLDAADDVTTVFARPLPRAACRKEVPPVFAYLQGAFDSQPSDAVPVMAVAAGGAATFTVPFASRSSSD
jgi:hypothetical protein